ncbi:MAG: HD domain-containing protein [SAR324 cluster bacterium]|nr:HD domain-containing protein [SAR324 cluster bacterium]
MSNPFPIYESRCPIHGIINFNEKERRIIDHPFYQRLRHISQLGFASYVYTGATHSRLAHSLGVMHLAGQIYDHIAAVEDNWLSELFNGDDLAYFRQIIRFAALLHDVGHPPFSHSSESLLPDKKSLELPQEWYHTLSWKKQATHEDFSIAVIYALACEPTPLLSMEEAQDVCSLIDSNIRPSENFKQRCRLEKGNSKNIQPLLRHIISGEVDADRMDYLHRDSHYTGVNYGRFDIDHLVRSLSCIQTDDGIVLVLNHNALHAFEGFLMARLHMFLQVYLHKTLLPFDYYLKQALLDGEIDFEISGDLGNFLMARDDRMLSALYQAQEKKWASRIVFRKLAKRLFQFEHYHPPELKQTVLERLKENGIEALFLQSSPYLSMLSPEDKTPKTPLLLKNIVLGKSHYLPIQKVSLLLEQYLRTADVQYLYCEPADYQRACEVLIPDLLGTEFIGPTS